MPRLFATLLLTALTGCAVTRPGDGRNVWGRGGESDSVFHLTPSDPAPAVLARGTYAGHGNWDTMPLPAYARYVNVWPMSNRADTLWISAEEQYDGSYMVAVGIPYTVGVAGFSEARIKATRGSYWRIEVTK